MPSAASSPRTALVAGASGLVGGHLLRRLLDAPAWGRVTSLGRRTLDVAHPDLDQRIVDFDHLDRFDIPPADDAFCCLGTTIKKAGSEAAFKKVDVDYVVAFAAAAREAGAEQLAVVSALGANAKSFVFYNRIKGEMEEAVARLGFGSVAIVRPALLLGDRDEDRSGEALAQTLMPLAAPLLLGPLRKYRPIRGEAVADALVAAAQVRSPGVHAYESDELQRIASASGR